MKTILVVDDDIVSLTTAKNVLGADYKVIIVKSGAQALTYVGKNTCDLILLDINMPEMDGFETFGKLRETESAAQVPIIFLTSDNDARTETKCFETGAIDFISKPFVPSVIRSRVARVLELEDLRKSLADRLEKKTQEVSDIKTKSRQDALTGLWNRAYTEEQVNAIINGGGCGSLLMIDMDNFKAINDNYGHIAGDQTLKMFADTMRAHSKESDVLCRIGGDEFVAFIEGCVSKSEIANLASDIIADLCRKIEEKNYNTNTSVSIGIAMTGTDGSEFTKLYNCADKALYYVKQNGKNSFHFFSDQSDAERERGSTKVDLKYLSEMLSRADGGTGAYILDFDSFHHVYNFIRRFVGRSGSSVQTLLFTAVSTTPDELEDAETEIALEMLDKAIYSSLRRVDVSTRYSSRQMIVILMDASTEDSSIVADRIIDAFEKLYIGGKVKFKYDIADMSKDMKLVQREQGSE